MTRAIIGTALLILASAAFAEDEVEVRRILILDKNMKPAAAAAQPKYDYVRVKTQEGKPNPELLCDACCRKGAFKEYASKPALEGKTVAYICANCNEMCYRENGAEVKYTDEKEVKALKEIESQLRRPVDKTQKPTAQNLQRLGRQ